MDKVSNYRQIVCQFLQDFAQDDPEAQLIFDIERDRYQILNPLIALVQERSQNEIDRKLNICVLMW